MEEVYVVTCYVEGCEECGDTRHVLGVYRTKCRAEAAEKNHNADKSAHIHHPYNTDVEKFEVQK